MHIAVLGTGMVGRTLAGRLAGLGHVVVLGTRDPAASRARTEGDDGGLTTWLADHPTVTVLTFAEAAASAGVVINATGGSVSLTALRLAGASNLAGKVLIDVSNPLDFSAGMPPTLFVKDTDSLGEQIQRAFPEAKVVKTLNTMSALVMVSPELVGEESTVFVSGNDLAAKTVVAELLASFGHTDVIDLGDISTARGTEMFLPLWLRLWGALDTPIMNIKVVR